MKSRTRITTITITKVALSTAIICILGPLSFTIPISPVPVSLGILGIFFAVYVNGWLWGTVSCLLYLLLGFVGVPVFTGFSAGVAKLLGPTGGYMIGYIFLSLIAGFFITKFEKKIPLHILGMVLGTACCYALGTAWLAISLKMSFTAALMVGVVPFIPADAVKMAVAVAVGIPVRRAVKRMSADTDPVK
ncbi:MAG: biotin transporter BioY [Lachnospiraceae bacterium]|nr:biotin transporter BioY [Lachnospiraceae bacterium]